MNLSDDKKLEAFLKENRPLHPRHSERDGEKIWEKIANSKTLPFWKQPRLIYGSFATAAAALIAAWSFSFKDTEVTSAPSDEVALIEESLDPDYLENGEIYEVSDLLSLAK